MVDTCYRAVFQGALTLVLFACSRAPESASTSAAQTDIDGCGLHEQPHRDPPPGASATALDPAEVPRVTTISVSAHEGAALLRKQGNGWVSIGKRGCPVPDVRISTALANLAQLTVAKQHLTWPIEGKFELQIDVLNGEQHSVHLEVGARRGDTDLVKLLNDDVVELRGLDRALWSADPAGWCSNPEPSTSF